MRAFFLVGSLALVAVVVACGAAVEPTPGVDGGGDGDGEPEYVVFTSEDEITLLACAIEEPCMYPSHSQQIEGEPDATVETSRCLLESLAAGRQGRYRHRTEHVFSNGAYGANHTLIVTGDRTALYARVPYGGFDDKNWLDEPPDPGQRCTLKPQSYFEDCLADIQIEHAGGTPRSAPPRSLAFECVFGDGFHERTSHMLWFESCEVASPLACE